METKSNVTPLSDEELQNIYGGGWWEVKLINGEFVFIFHWRD